MRREKTSRPQQILSSREGMRIFMLTLVAVAMFFFLYQAFRNPHYFDTIMGRAVPENLAGKPVPTPSIADREHCSSIDAKLLETVRDKTPSQTEDNPAIYQLLCVAATISPQELEKKSRATSNWPIFFVSRGVPGPTASPTRSVDTTGPGGSSQGKRGTWYRAIL